MGPGYGDRQRLLLLPAQNAAGNWIKVVQRLPVRIELDAKQLADHPLRIGLSTLVTVDTATATVRSLQSRCVPAQFMKVTPVKLASIRSAS